MHKKTETNTENGKPFERTSIFNGRDKVSFIYVCIAFDAKYAKQGRKKKERKKKKHQQRKNNGYTHRKSVFQSGAFNTKKAL